ncbi:helix-turn-helix transcriptional regulator [Microbulbifer sp. 2304DJ12-6]|uniref:helix-turn-helix transcriptional regulator n=1 Tax=Microbulbifer sp. 2304DJ12-6 TaxID=3233340 RepID=UPI0039AFC641
MNRIADYRKKAGLTQAEAAAKASWEHQSRWSSYETGARVPGVDDVRRILRVLNSNGAPCSFDEVFPAPGSHDSAA